LQQETNLEGIVEANTEMYGESQSHLIQSRSRATEKCLEAWYAIRDKLNKTYDIPQDFITSLITELKTMDQGSTKATIEFLPPLAKNAATTLKGALVAKSEFLNHWEKCRLYLPDGTKNPCDLKDEKERRDALRNLQLQISLASVSDKLVSDKLVSNP
jgi:hypothetical protein